jgi:uncharacterized protein YukE
MPRSYTDLPILTSDERELVLRILKEREQAIRADFADFKAELSQLRESQGELSEDLRGVFDRLSSGVDRLFVAIDQHSTVLMQHMQAESEADSRRDGTIGEQGAALARLATTIGGVAGAKAGRVEVAKWAPAVSAIVAGALWALAQILGIGK